MKETEELRVMKEGWNFFKGEMLNQYWNFTTSKKKVTVEDIAGRATEDKGGWAGWRAHKEYEEWVKSL